MPAVQLQITTLDNPIHINPNAIAHALATIDIVVIGADVQWATAQEWADLMDPTTAGGRHSKSHGQWTDSRVMVRLYDGPNGGFVRDYIDEDYKDLEAI